MKWSCENSNLNLNLVLVKQFGVKNQASSTQNKWLVPSTGISDTIFICIITMLLVWLYLYFFSSLIDHLKHFLYLTLFPSHMQTGGARDWTADFLVNGQPALPPEQQPLTSRACVCVCVCCISAHPLWQETGFLLQFWPRPVSRFLAKPLQSFPGARLCRMNTHLDSAGKKI